MTPELITQLRDMLAERGRPWLLPLFLAVLGHGELRLGPAEEPTLSPFLYQHF